MHSLEDIFGENGPLQRALPGFTYRRQQLQMAESIAAALAERTSLIVEAGTGTGKTFSYLVPALLAGARILISTGTRTLQDQLYAKDLPLVAAAIGRPAKVALLKGRSNYLCRHHLGRASMQLALAGGTAADRTLGRIARWSHTTRSGDLAEVPGLSDSHAVWPLVTSTRDNCLGQGCPEYSRCHVVLARRVAQESDIVIVNHHLLLADLALKEDGFGDILGSADAVILDEAHQLPDLAVQSFGVTVSGRRIESLLKEVDLALAQRARPAGAVRELAVAGAAGEGGVADSAHEPAAARALDAALRTVGTRVRDLTASLPRRPGRAAWSEVGEPLEGPVQALADSLDAFADLLDSESSEVDVPHLAARARELAAALEHIAGREAVEGARSVETSSRGFSLSLLPFDISARFQSVVKARSCAWVFTSATLSVGDNFSHFADRLGLGDAETLKIDSPFDYESQSLLYLPAGLPNPSAPGYVAAVIEVALPLIAAAGGGAFLLFTSHRALAEGAALLRVRWGEDSPARLYVQGEAPREQLLAEFRADGNGVLLGTTSFWEGVDVKGQALRLVIIEKLPFASPDDPLVKARIDHLEASGGNAFRDYQLPEAALSLKQGVGRLIRSEDDHGVVVICDPRLLSRSYGKSILAALPPMPVTRDPAETASFLARFAG